MKMNDILIDFRHISKRGIVRLFKKGGKIQIILSKEEVIHKEQLNNHEKRLFSLFEKKLKFLRSFDYDMKKNQINWGKAELIMKSKICNKEIHFFFYEELVKGSDYMVFKPFVAYDKDIIASINVFNSLEVSF